MSNRLFDLEAPSSVAFDPDPSAKWTIGFDLQASSAATDLSVQDPCESVDDAVTIAGESEAAPPVYTVLPFAANVRASRHNRCALGIELQLVQDLLMNGGQTAAAEYVLWNGIDTWDAAVQPSLQNDDVHTVVVAASVAATLAAALVEYATLTVLDPHVIHLGLNSAIELSAAGYFYSTDTDGSLRLRATGAPIVISPYYPADGVAVTGPIKVQVGPPEAFQVFEQDINVTRIWGNSLIALSFDPSTAVRAE